MRVILLVGILSVVSFQMQAQGLGNVDEIFKMYQNDVTGGAADAERYFDGYLGPAVKGLGFGISGGWFNSAETHKPFGFDITVTVTGAFVPDGDLTFDFTNPNTIDVISPTDSQLPTVMGAETAPTLAIKGSGEQFDGLPGFGLKDNIGYNIVPTPMAQLGIGLPKGTELKIRFIPEIATGDFMVKMFGIGVMHDVKQWIPGLKLAPFHLSGFFGFNRMQFSNGFDTANTKPGTGALAFGFNSVTFQGIISKKLSVVTVYAAAGVATTTMNLQVNGEYDINNDPTIYELVDPIDMDIVTTGPKVSAGFRLKLAVITLHADYTLQKYNALTVGVGISIK